MQPILPEDPQDQTIFTPQVKATSGQESRLDPVGKPGQAGATASFFYLQDQEDALDLQLPLIDEQDDPVAQSAPFALPFQHSAALPPLAQRDAPSAQGAGGTFSPSGPSAGTQRKRAVPIGKAVLLVSMVLVTLIGASVLVFAQAAPSLGRTPMPLTPSASAAHTIKPVQAPPARTPPPAAGSSSGAVLPAQPQQGQPGQGPGSSSASTIPSAAFLQQLGWTQAGLGLGDAIEALRTGATFTDREMSYDYRNIGTLAAHAGTLTGSTFLLTPGGLVRFARNDVRVINNVLYDKIRTYQMIQQVVNAQPALVHVQLIQVQGQPRLFAWVDVAFELFQSMRDPVTGQRTERLELNPATGQPALHHLVVVLVRVAPQNQGTNAPMGGTGWLVDTYALDANTLPALAADPFL